MLTDLSLCIRSLYLGNGDVVFDELAIERILGWCQQCRRVAVLGLGRMTGDAGALGVDLVGAVDRARQHTVGKLRASYRVDRVVLEVTGSLTPIWDLASA